MPSKQADKNTIKLESLASPVVAQGGTVNPIIDSHPVNHPKGQPWSREWDRTMSDLAAITDETDTDEIWSEVLRNLGVGAETEED